MMASQTSANGLIPAPAGLHLARAEVEVGSEIPGQRHLGAGLAADELGQTTGEFAFRASG